MSDTPVGVLLLAAGFSRRFGSDKRLHLIAEKPLLQLTIEAITASELPLRVCLRGADDPVLELVQTLGAQTLMCDRSEEGMGVSLAQGIARCQDWHGALIALGDMAWVRPATYGKLAAELRPGYIVAPQTGGKAGNPVGFSAEYFGQLRELTGDKGARALVERHRAQLKLLEVNDPGIFRDLDSPSP